MKVEIVEARLEHVIYLVEHLRDNERAICEKMYGADFEKIVTKEIAGSMLAWAGLVDGKCGALWGVKMTRILSDEGMLWMIGTHLIDEYPITFLRQSRQVVRKLHGTFKKLYGCVLTDYSQSRRWLEWLGFEIGEDQGGICYCEYRFV